jgi:hypothetical protein
MNYVEQLYKSCLILIKKSILHLILYLFNIEIFASCFSSRDLSPAGDISCFDMCTGPFSTRQPLLLLLCASHFFSFARASCLVPVLPPCFGSSVRSGIPARSFHFLRRFHLAGQFFQSFVLGAAVRSSVSCRPMLVCALTIFSS